MQTDRPNLARGNCAHALLAPLARVHGPVQGHGAAGVAAVLALLIVTGCTGDPEPAVDAAPDAGDAAPVIIDAGVDAGLDAAPDIDAALPIACAQPPQVGSLCGPERACEVLADSTLPSAPAFRNDAPAVAVDDPCQPQVSFSVAEGGFRGFHARLGADGFWAVSETPFPIATVAAEVAPGGAPLLLTDDGAFGVRLWQQDAAGGWFERPVPGDMHANAAGMQRSSDGVVHAALRDSSGLVHHARIAEGAGGTWQLTPLGERSDARTVLALSGNGAPHLLWWRSDSAAGDWLLRWSHGDGDIETVAALGSSSLEIESQRHAVAVGPADAGNPGGRPHVLFARRTQANPGVVELLYATRTGPGTWTTTRIDDSEVPDASSCNHDPLEPGETCDVRADALRPIGAVAGPAGEVRLFHVEQHLDYTLVATCRPTPRGEYCEWNVGEDRSTAELYVAWPNEDGGVSRAVVADIFLASAGTVALDSVGTVHVALYGTQPGSDGQLVRYLRVGP